MRENKIIFREQMIFLTKMQTTFATKNEYNEPLPQNKNKRNLVKKEDIETFERFYKCKTPAQLKYIWLEYGCWFDITSTDTLPNPLDLVEMPMMHAFFDCFEDEDVLKNGNKINGQVVYAKDLVPFAFVVSPDEKTKKDPASLSCFCLAKNIEGVSSEEIVYMDFGPEFLYKNLSNVIAIDQALVLLEHVDCLEEFIKIGEEGEIDFFINKLTKVFGLDNKNIIESILYEYKIDLSQQSLMLS